MREGGGHENVWLSVEWHPGWDSPVSGLESDWRLLVPGQGGEGGGGLGWGSLKAEATVASEVQMEPWSLRVVI